MEKNLKKSVCITESLCILETNIALWINYTSLKKKNDAYSGSITFPVKIEVSFAVSYLLSSLLGLCSWDLEIQIKIIIHG